MSPQRHHVPAWAVLSLMCLAQFMVVLDVSIVNVALPSIREDLGFTQTGLQWIVNTYALAFAGFLLLGGRAADLFGRRRMFMVGLALFTGASLVGGFAQDPTTLLIARAAQGLGGAVLSPATLTILTTTFDEGPARSKALGVWSAVAGAGGATGAVLGGVLTDTAGWRWILFVNVPIGVLALLGARTLLVESKGEQRSRALDVPGAVLVTSGLLLLVYGIVGTESAGWTSPRTVLTLVAGLALLGGFLLFEARGAKEPLMPLGIFANRSVSGANLVMICVGGSIFASWFFTTLYLQGVLGFSPMRTGFAFLPQTVAIITGAQVSSRLVSRIGPRPLLVVGPLISALGLLLLSRISADGTYLGDVLVPSVLVTLGVGLAFTPATVAATAGVKRAEAGLASGLVNTSRQVGGALGLAVLATLAEARTRSLLPADALAALEGRLAPGTRLPQEALEALTSGYAQAFLVAAGISVLAAVTASTLPKVERAVRAEEKHDHAGVTD